MAKKDHIPLAINFRKLQRYNFKYFSYDEIALFEYLIVLAQAFNFKEFYHSQSTIEKETGLKRSRQERILRKFIDIGIISSVVVKGMPPVKWFTLDFERINSLLPAIYKCVEDHNMSDEFYKILTDYYRQLVENSKKTAGNNQQENINKNNKERIKEDSEIDFFEEDRLMQLPYSSEEFTQAWSAWLKYHKDKKSKLPQASFEAHLSLLRKQPERIGMAMIYNAIQKGYNGLFEVPYSQIEMLIPPPKPKRSECWNEDYYLFKCKKIGVEPVPLPEQEITYDNWPYDEASPYRKDYKTEDPLIQIDKHKDSEDFDVVEELPF